MSKLTAIQAHQVADQANEALFTRFISDLHVSLKRHAERGNYKANVSIPVEYRGKILSLIQYFTMFGYTVSVSNSTLTIGW